MLLVVACNAFTHEIPSVLCSAKLFVERDVACGQIEQKMSLLDQLTADISALEEKVEKQQRQKEKDKVCTGGCKLCTLRCTAPHSSPSLSSCFVDHTAGRCGASTRHSP